MFPLIGYLVLPTHAYPFRLTDAEAKLAEVGSGLPNALAKLGPSCSGKAIVGPAPQSDRCTEVIITATVVAVTMALHPDIAWVSGKAKGRLARGTYL